MTGTLVSLILRIGLFAVFASQGIRKLFGERQAPHGLANLESMIQAAGLPWPGYLARMVAATELICGTFVGVGFMTRVAAVPLAGIVFIAIIGFKRPQGFVGGWDWPFSVLIMAVAIFLLGAGMWSLDSLLRVPLR